MGRVAENSPFAVAAKPSFTIPKEKSNGLFTICFEASLLPALDMVRCDPVVTVAPVKPVRATALFFARPV